MTSTPYRIELQCRISESLLRPYVDDLVITRTRSATRLCGLIRDSAHLHGLVAHLAVLGIELVAVEAQPGQSLRAVP